MSCVLGGAGWRRWVSWPRPQRFSSVQFNSIPFHPSESLPPLLPLQIQLSSAGFPSGEPACLQGCARALFRSRGRPDCYTTRQQVASQSGAFVPLASGGGGGGGGGSRTSGSSTSTSGGASSAKKRLWQMEVSCSNKRAQSWLGEVTGERVEF